MTTTVRPIVNLMSLLDFKYVAIVLFALPMMEAIATTGSWEVVQAEELLPQARKDPDAFLRRFNEGEPNDRKRMVLFMVLTELGQENLISRGSFKTIVTRGSVDLSSDIRGHSVHFFDQVFDDDKLQAEYRRSTLDKSSHVRYNAAEQLRDYPSEESLPYLDSLLGDESIEVRDRAAATLYIWFSEHDVDTIETVFVKATKSRDLRRAGCATVILALYFNRKPDLQTLESYLDSELGKRPPYSGSDNTRLIIRSLSAIGSPTSRPVLEKAANHSHTPIANEAKRSLENLNSQGQSATRVVEPSNSPKPSR